MPRFTRTLSALAATALFAGVGVTQADASSTPAGITTPADPANVSIAALLPQGILLDAGPILRKKYNFKTEWLGPIEAGGQLGDCYDYGKQSPDGKWHVGKVADVKDSEQRAEIQWLENQFFVPGLKSRSIAAARKSAVNRIRSAEFRSDWKSSYVGQLKTKGSGVAAMSDRMLADAKRYAGTVKLTGSFTVKAKPGVTGTVVVKATANGHPYVGRQVQFTLANTTVKTATKTTGADGTAVLKFIPTGAAAVKVSGNLISPEWRLASYSVPSSNLKQHLVRNADRSTVKTPWSSSYDTKFSTTVTQDCGSVCTGKPPITFTAKAGASPVQWRAMAGTKQVAFLSLKAGAEGSRTFTGADAQVYALQYRVYVGGKWSTWRTSQTITAVCPAWPGMTPTKTCVCKGGGSISYAVTGPGGSRFYVARFTIDGVPQEQSFTGAGSVKFTTPLKAGTTVLLEFIAYADAGHTNQLSTGVLDAFTQGH
jgi:hypothetical protein